MFYQHFFSHRLYCVITLIIYYYTVDVIAPSLDSLETFDLLTSHLLNQLLSYSLYCFLGSFVNL
jgi:hypothetical protein